MEDKNKITKVRKNDEGDITDVMLEDGSVVSLEEAIQMSKNDELDGVNVGRSRSGTEFLRADPDGDTNNNLDNMPTF